MQARKRFGQHFLVDTEVIQRIISALALRTHDKVLEIGPGRGALTGSLVDLVDDLKAVEIDRDLSALLRVRYPTLTVIEDDVLSCDLGLAAGRRVVGNLPYNISTPLLNRLFDVSGLVDMTFMLQKEVVDRLSASPGTKSWGRLGIAAQYHCEVHSLFDVAPTAFEPRPKVTSSIVRLVPRAPDVAAKSVSRLQDVARIAFSQRRKRLSNSLKSLDVDWGQVGIDPGLRAEDVGVAGFVAIANSLPAR